MSTLQALADSAPRASIHEAYREHASFIGRIIRRLTGDGPHVDDLLQETFIIAFRKLDRFDGRSALRTWLYGIASNLCRRHVRSRSRFKALTARLLGEPLEPSAPQADALEHDELARQLRAAIAKLPFEQREVIILYELEQYPGQEVAELLGIPAATVWTRLHRGRTTLKRTLSRGGMP